MAAGGGCSRQAGQPPPASLAKQPARSNQRRLRPHSGRWGGCQGATHLKLHDSNSSPTGRAPPLSLLPAVCHHRWSGSGGAAHHITLDQCLGDASFSSVQQRLVGKSWNSPTLCGGIEDAQRATGRRHLGGAQSFLQWPLVAEDAYRALIGACVVLKGNPRPAAAPNKLQTRCGQSGQTGGTANRFVAALGRTGGCAGS